MAFIKWIGGALGFIFTGSVLGSMAGYALGSMVDALYDSNDDDNNTGTAAGNGNSQQQSYDQGWRNSFMFTLMVLSADIIQADGKIMHSEMECVRRFLRQSFGNDAAVQGNDILHRLFDYRKQQGEQQWRSQIRRACAEVASALNVEARIQLVAYLADIIKADGKINDAEVAELRQLTAWMGLDSSMADQMLAIGGNSLDDAYKVLGITPNATDDEVRTAYRKMVLQNHPDRVANLGDDVKEAATRKLQEINEAKNAIYKARGME